MSRPQRSARPGNPKEVSFSEEEMEPEAIIVNIDSNDVNSLVDDVDNLDVLPSLGDFEDPNAIPRVTQNLMEFDLNHFNQYKKLIEFCNRYVIKNHDKRPNRKDHGSVDRGLIYIFFNAGMFEALKKNMMRILKEMFKIELIKQPKVEFYGNAKEHIHLDIKVYMNGQEHKMKIKVYNTACSLDVQALGIPLLKTFPHLSNLTCMDFFIQNMMLKIIEKIKSHVDIKS